MKTHPIFAKTWFRFGGMALVLGAVLLAMLLSNLPASAEPPEPIATPLPQADEEYIPKPIVVSTPRPLESGTDLLTPPPCDLEA